ncbi:hypothetical protein HY604_00710 [Candidatus Peregrinibacteria bacterium]|nr:hypothetical protein [Candidatus Peregrinibacteria bacterium]
MSFLLRIFKAYDYKDWVFTLLFFAIILLMIVKMIFLPYGLFGFGESNIYTEGIVAKSGIQNINPLFVDYNEADREVSKLVFSGLMKYDPSLKAVVDDVGKLSINEDKTQYTFVVRDGLKWHDGKALTVADVYFTYHDIIQNPSFPNEILKTNFSGVEITLVNEKTIKFALEKPNVFFVTNFTTGILPQHILKNFEADEILSNEFNKMPIGSGPYMVTEPVEAFSDGRMQVTLQRSPYYYGDPLNIEFLRFITYPTTDLLISEIDSMNGVVKITGNYIADFRGNERFKLISYQLPQYTAVFFNMDSKILKDNKLVRISLLKATDKSVLLEQFIDKIPVDTPLMELNQAEWEYQPAIDQAQGALKDAGFLYDKEDTLKQGIRYDEDGNALELNLIVRLYDEGTVQFMETKAVVNYLNDVWESIGFSIQVEFLPLEDFNARVSARSYDLLLVGQGLGYNLDTYSYWHSSQANPLGQNLANYKSFAVDSLIEDVRSTFDEKKRAESLKNLAKQLKEDVPAIFLYRPVYYYASDGKVSGILMDNVVFSSDRFYNVNQWKFER